MTFRRVTFVPSNIGGYLLLLVALGPRKKVVCSDAVFAVPTHIISSFLMLLFIVEQALLTESFLLALLCKA